MNNQSWITAALRPAGVRAAAGAILTITLLAASGCHPAMIPLLFGQDREVPAEFTLTKAPLLVMIEEDTGGGGQIAARYRYQLQKTLDKQFRDNKVNQQVVPDRQVQEYLSVHPTTGLWSAAQLGKAMNAEQVLHIQLEPPVDNDRDMFNPTSKFQLAASVRVIDVQTRNQLWPVETAGRNVVFTLKKSDMHAAEENADLNEKALADGLAEHIARLFHKHTISGTEMSKQDAEAYGLK
jgi:hypothetical protein